MKYAVRKQTIIANGHNCSAEEVIFSKFPIVASAMCPTMFTFLQYFLLVSVSVCWMLPIMFL